MRRSLLVGMLALAVAVSSLQALACPPSAEVGSSCPNTSANGVNYSGTSAGVCGSFTGGGSAIKKVELWVNGVRRYQKVWTSNYPTTWSCSAPFSTTQFSSGSTLTLKAKVWTTSLEYAEDIDTSHKTRNSGYALPNTDLNVTSLARAQAAAACFSTANHVWVCDYWGATDIQETLIPMGTAFHVTSHGDADSFGDSFADEESGDNHYVDSAEIAAAVASKSSSQCRFNFVFLDSCFSAGLANLYSAWNTVSYVGWTGAMYDNDDYKVFVQTFYSDLSAQTTVAYAAAHAAEVSDVTAYVYGSGGYRVHKTYPSV